MKRKQVFELNDKEIKELVRNHVLDRYEEELKSLVQANVTVRLLYDGSPNSEGVTAIVEVSVDHG